MSNFNCEPKMFHPCLCAAVYFQAKFCFRQVHLRLILNSDVCYVPVLISCIPQIAMKGGKRPSNSST